MKGDGIGRGAARAGDRRRASTSEAAGISSSGRTAFAAPSAIAAFGIPKTTQVLSSSAKVAAPAFRSARSPRAPSSPMPVRRMPIARGPAAAATDWKSTSTLGRCRDTRSPSSRRTR
jgi:hypothetical protein